MIVVLSWLSFWIDPGVVTARTSLSVVPIMAITTESFSVAKTSPSGPYTKASDVWLTVCFVFVFCAFLEYLTINVLLRRSKKAKVIVVMSMSFNVFIIKKNNKLINVVLLQPSNQENFVNLAVDPEDSPQDKSFVTGIIDRLEKYRKRILSDPARWVEKTSRYFFPGLFVFFNIIYWSYYLTRYSKLK